MFIYAKAAQSKQGRPSIRVISTYPLILPILYIDVSSYRSMGARTMLPYSVQEPS